MAQARRLKAGATPRVSLAAVRRHWASLQGLSAAGENGPAAIAHASGWMIVAGSTGPYLALRARSRHLDRARVDAAIFDQLELVEAPAMRAQRALLAADDLALALAAARRVHEQHVTRVREATELLGREWRALKDSVRRALEGGPLSSAAIRDYLPDDRVRNLGEAGRRLGEPSSLGLALGELEAAGEVERRAEDRRLDARGHLYHLRVAPVIPLDLDPPELNRRLAERFLAWAGPASVDELAFWAGIAKGEARAASAAISAVEVEVEEGIQPAFVAPSDLPRLQADARRQGAGQGRFLLLPFRDNAVAHRRELAALVASSHRSLRLLGWNGRPQPLAGQPSLHHHAIFEGPTLAGVWEWDPKARQVAWATFDAKRGAALRALEAEVEATGKRIRDELGDLRFYPFDGAAGRARRIAAVKAYARDWGRGRAGRP